MPRRTRPKKRPIYRGPEAQPKKDGDRTATPKDEKKAKPQRRG